MVKKLSGYCPCVVCSHLGASKAVSADLPVSNSYKSRLAKGTMSQVGNVWKTCGFVYAVEWKLFQCHLHSLSLWL